MVFMKIFYASFSTSRCFFFSLSCSSSHFYLIVKWLWFLTTLLEDRCSRTHETRRTWTKEKGREQGCLAKWKITKYFRSQKTEAFKSSFVLEWLATMRYFCRVGDITVVLFYVLSKWVSLALSKTRIGVGKVEQAGSSNH